MTINRGWIEIFKTVSGTAFSKNLPDDSSVKTVFIDGQLKLQRASGIETWQKFLDVQFMYNIQRYLASGITTLVLAFDDHGYSPAAKGPTQQKRRSRVTAADWHERMPLPSSIPAEYEILLFNRTFKTRVIEFVIESVVKKFHPLLKDGQSIIIDHRGDAMMLHAGGSVTMLVPETPLGESDVKFVRYLHLGDMLLDAVDSDYVIIAMNQVEKLQNCGASKKNMTALPNIFVRRMLVDIDKVSLADKKRKLQNAGNGRLPREYEHVNINILTDAMQKVLGKIDDRMQGKNAGLRPIENDEQTLRGSTIKVLSYLVALCGCDFTKGIPWFGPKTLWKNIDVVWWGMRRAALSDQHSGCKAVSPRAIAEYIVSPLWRNVLYKNHCKQTQTPFTMTDGTNFEETYAQLASSCNLNARVRDNLITNNALSCLVKNCNWVSIYWRDPEQCPDGVEKRFGFVRNSKGLVRFDTDACLDDAYC